jgi:hypothetical protein
MVAMFLGLAVDLAAPHVAGFFADVKYFPSGNVEDKVAKIGSLLIRYRTYSTEIDRSHTVLCFFL